MGAGTPCQLATGEPLLRARGAGVNRLASRLVPAALADQIWDLRNSCRSVLGPSQVVAVVGSSGYPSCLVRVLVGAESNWAGLLGVDCLPLLGNVFGVGYRPLGSNGYPSLPAGRGLGRVVVSDRFAGQALPDPTDHGFDAIAYSSLMEGQRQQLTAIDHSLDTRTSAA